jgi:hypothetical protein
MKMKKLISTIALCAVISLQAIKDLPDFYRVWKIYLSSPDKSAVDEIIAVYNELRPGNKIVADERMRTDLGVHINELIAIQVAQRTPGAINQAQQQELERVKAELVKLRGSAGQSVDKIKQLQQEIDVLNELLKKAQQGQPVPPAGPTQPQADVDLILDGLMLRLGKLANADASNVDSLGASAVRAAQELKTKIQSPDALNLIASEFNKGFREQFNALMNMPVPISELAAKKVWYLHEAYKALSNGYYATFYDWIVKNVPSLSKQASSMLQVQGVPVIAPTVDELANLKQRVDTALQAVEMSTDTTVKKAREQLKSAIREYIKAADRKEYSSGQIASYAFRSITAPLRASLQSKISNLFRELRMQTKPAPLDIKKLAAFYAGYIDFGGTADPELYEYVKTSGAVGTLPKEEPTEPVVITPTPTPTPTPAPGKTPEEEFSDLFKSMMEARAWVIEAEASPHASDADGGIERDLQALKARIMAVEGFIQKNPSIQLSEQEKENLKRARANAGFTV